MKFKVARTSDRGNNEQPCVEAVYQHTGKSNINQEDTYDWFVELNGLDELTKFCAEYGNVIVSTDNGDWQLEIYDDYRE